MEAMENYMQLFFEWLVRSTLIAGIVICLILLVQKLFGNKLGPRWSYALWLVLLIRMVLPWTPSSRISLLNLIPSWDRQVEQQQLYETTQQQETPQLVQAIDSTEAIPTQEYQSDLANQKQSLI
jgi:beta-lactamase regulating signal transducer with metallopeptidase domain